MTPVTTGAHYTVLARRFRPQAFDDVVGQEHVSRALTNAIKAGRVAHAYMFTGARGVGKTSTARILAKALNCPNTTDGVPCNHCEICDGISSGNDVDVLEIDGASNRGIDDIRSLRANVGVRSMRTQYKVYIIDEVHMLTKEAFNALLKTLEEPPPNVKFVFCTTEPNKVPDTILSRCQRFDFSSIADGSIADRLREIAKMEGFEVAEDALELVSRRARGSMRDSQSLFDQLLAFSDGTVTADDVHRMLGTAGDERLIELFHAIIEHRPGEVLASLDSAFGLGVQPGELMDQAIGYVRDLMVTASGGSTVSLCSVAVRHREVLLDQARQLGLQSILAAFQILSDAKNQMFRSTFARTVLEMAMVQLSLLENLTALSDLLSGRLPSFADLPAPGTTVSPSAGAISTGSQTTGGTADEKKNAGGLSPNSTSPSGSRFIRPEENASIDDSYDENENDDDDDFNSGDGVSGGNDSSQGNFSQSVNSQNVNSRNDAPSSELSAAVVVAESLNSEPASQKTGESVIAPAAGSESQASLQTAASAPAANTPAANTPTAVTASNAPPAVTSPAAAEPEVSSVEIELTEENLGRLMQSLHKGLGLTIVAGLRKASALVLATPGRLEIVLDNTADFARKVLDNPDNRSKIENEVLRLTGRQVAIGLRLVAPEMAAEIAPPIVIAAASTNPSRRAEPTRASSAAKSPETPQAVNLLGKIDPSQDPFVRRVMETFGATVVKVTVAPAVQVVNQAEDSADS